MNLYVLKSKTINNVFYLYNFADVLAILFFKFELLFPRFRFSRFWHFQTVNFRGKKEALMT